MCAHRVSWALPAVRGVTMYKKIFVAALLTFLFLWPAFSQNPYYVHTGITIGIMVMLAVGLNLLFGYTGQISLAHSSFYAIGAYTASLLEVHAGLSFWLSTPIGVALAAFVAILIGIPTLKLKDHYLALATLALCLVTSLFLINAKWLTNGSEGVMGIQAPTLFGHAMKGVAYYYFVMVLTVIIFVLIRNLVNSRVGIALETIRENEDAAAALGVNVLYYKVMVFAIAGALAALAGSLYGHLTLFVSPESFGLTLSIEVLVIIVIGGLASMLGSAIGAVVITLLPELLYEFEEYRLLVYGVILLLVVLFAPKGIVGLLTSLTKFIQSKFGQSKAGQEKDTIGQALVD
jgi:branched-chain amino acid transport system permease protein